MNAYGIVIDDNGHDVVDGNVLSQMYYAIDASSAGDTKIKNNTATAVTVKYLGGTQLPGTKDRGKDSGLCRIRHTAPRKSRKKGNNELIKVEILCRNPAGPEARTEKVATVRK